MNIMKALSTIVLPDVSNVFIEMDEEGVVSVVSPDFQAEASLLRRNLVLQWYVTKRIGPSELTVIERLLKNIQSERLFAYQGNAQVGHLTPKGQVYYSRLLNLVRAPKLHESIANTFILEDYNYGHAKRT